METKLPVKYQNTVKIIRMQFFGTIMEIGFVTMSINMVHNLIIYVWARRSHQDKLHLSLS